MVQWEIVYVQFELNITAINITPDFVFWQIPAERFTLPLLRRERKTFLYVKKIVRRTRASSFKLQEYRRLDRPQMYPSRMRF